MAEKEYLGTTGDFGLGTNWSGGTLPVTGDNIYIVDTATSISSNYNALAAVSPAKVVIGDGMTGTFGDSATNRIEFAAITELRFASGGLKTFIEATTITDLIITGGAGGADMLQLVDGGSLAVTTLTASGGIGTTTIPASASITNVVMAGVPSTHTLIVGVSVSGFTGKIQQDSGIIQLFTAPPEIRTYGNAILYVEEGAGAIATMMEVSDNSQIVYRGEGTITNGKAWGNGIIDFRQNRYPGTVTMTNGFVYNGGTIDTRTPNSNIVITNKSSVGGGKFTETLA